MSGSLQFDVIIIGAGISGLTAAYNIKKRNPELSIIVLEANNQVGGRTRTISLRAASGTDNWDVGGQWVGGSQHHVMNLLKELKLETYRQYNKGKNLIQMSGKETKKYEGAIPQLSLPILLDIYQAMLKTNNCKKQINVEDPCSHPKAEEWDAMSAATYYNSILYTKGGHEMFKTVMRVIFGCEPSQISFLYYLMYVHQGVDLDTLLGDEDNMAQESKIKNGAQQISLELSSRIGVDNVKLDEAVLSITQSDGKVTVVTKSGWKGSASRVILAMPPKAIERIEFTPQLSRDRIDFTKYMPMGNYIKVIVTYTKAFWRSKDLSGLCGSSDYSLKERGGILAPLCVTMDDTSSNGNPALVGFMGGQTAVEWALRPDEERKEAVLEHLETFLGEEVLSYLDYVEKDWNKEPYCYGAPVSLMSVGGMKNFSKAVRRVEGRLHFAGTETATEWTGYMSGAVQAGERCALEVLGVISPASLSEQDKQLISGKKTDT